MTNPRAIHTVGASLVTFLEKAFESEGAQVTGISSCDFRLLSSGEIAGLDEPTGLTLPTVSFYLFQVTVNEFLRNVRRVSGTSGPDVPLPLDLHYLLTVWSDNAEQEHVLLAWAMRELYVRPVLDGSLLHADANWFPGDVVQIVPADLKTEDMMRLWDALKPSYRLSVAYIARVVRIDPDAGAQARPVVAMRSSYMEQTGP